MYEHILITTDGSDVAQKGVDHGLALARAFGARVTILVVSEVTMPYAGAGQASAFTYQDLVSLQKEAAQSVLAAVQEQARGIGMPAEVTWRENVAPADAIVETAGARGCSLIVMASHGRRGLRRLMLGSVTSEVLVLSPVPVLVVR